MSKTYILIAVIVFTAFLVLGFVHGRSDASQPDALIQNATKYTHFAHDDKKQIQLVYSCDTDIYVWNVAAKQYSISPDEARRRLDSGMGQPTVPITTQRLSVLTGSLGGAVAAWTLKDLVSVMEQGKSGKVIGIVIVGAISGYGAGYAMGMHKLPKCDSTTMLSMLDDSISAASQSGSAVTTWKRLEKLTFQRKLLELFVLCDSIQDKETKKASKDVLAFLYHRVMAPDHQLDPEDVLILSGGERVVKKEAEQHTVTRMEKVLKVLVWLPLAVLFGLLAFLFAKAVWEHRREHRIKLSRATT